MTEANTVTVSTCIKSCCKEEREALFLISMD